ncbi:MULTISPECIES: hypothetical protein [Acidithiobacillus]|uniref:hypothetical protein n=1 Tax=Acidithiobacillus TaxID=119977 RepID=UPI001C0729DE|nr:MULTISPECIES: hypothetical protein [Acidithiobacillus]MBU2844947.1 hypothetical protein [Acidithiobacillus ferriphilus]
MKKEITFTLAVIVTSVALMGCSHAQSVKDTKAPAPIQKPATPEQHSQKVNANAPGGSINRTMANMAAFANIGKKGTKK